MFGPHLSGEQWLGLHILFFIFVPSLIIMGIWSVVRELHRDREWERSGDSFANDFHASKIRIPVDPPRFRGWREPILKKDAPGRLVRHREKYGK